MTFSKLSGFTYFSKTFQARKLRFYNAMTFTGFSRPPECDDRVRVSKSDKNIDAGGWRVDHLFEAADSDDVLAHPRIINAYTNKSRPSTVKNDGLLLSVWAKIHILFPLLSGKMPVNESNLDICLIMHIYLGLRLCKVATIYMFQR